MPKALIYFLFVLLSCSAFAGDFNVGDIVLDDYAGSLEKSTILDITSGGMVRTTHTSNEYIKIRRLRKFDGVKSYRAGNHVHSVGDQVFDDYANKDFIRFLGIPIWERVTIWNKSELLDITSDGLVKTSSTIGSYININRLIPYEKV